MDKKLILVFLAGWLLSIVFPPTRVLALFGKRGN
jgi:hypothetical protein